MSQLQALIDALPHGTDLPLDPDADPALERHTANPAFVRPPIQREGEHPDQLPPIIVVSAPGAVGKSELARYIAVEKACHVWNLAKLTVGSNTFRGTLARSFDPGEYSNLVRDFGAGRVLFVLDAFDEAEIRSGPLQVESFLKEIFGFVKDAPQPCVVMFARSSTAQNMIAWLELLAGDEEDTRLRHATFSINYFLKQQAEKFVMESLSRGDQRGVESNRGVYHRLLNRVFEEFYTANHADAETAWKSQVVRSFLGYAPVLQAIASFIIEEPGDNPLPVLNRLENDSNGTRIGAQLTCDIMDALLEREQGKLVERLKQTQEDKLEARGWDNWYTLYTPVEQLKRIFLYLKGSRDQAIAIDHALAEVPPWLVEDYQEALRNFLPTHPFIVEKRFAGPAFHDYTFARLLHAGHHLYNDVRVSWGKALLEGSGYVPSPLFALLYERLHDGIAYGDLLGYLYESALAQRGFSQEPLTVVIPADDPGAGFDHHFRMIDDDDDGIDASFRLRIISGEQHPITFHRRLAHAEIEVTGMLVLGQSDLSFELSDVQITCEKLLLHANTVMIRNYKEGENVSIRAASYRHTPMLVRVECLKEERVSITWPDGQEHPWSAYYRPSQTYDSPEMEEAAATLRRLLPLFRKHGRDDYARQHELIDNVAVGQNPMRRDMRDFLLERGIMEKKPFLYILHMRSLEQYGINWYAARFGDITEASKPFIREFFQWRASRT